MKGQIGLYAVLALNCACSTGPTEADVSPIVQLNEKAVAVAVAADAGSVTTIRGYVHRPEN